LPPDEDVRVQALRALEALDTAPEAELDALVEAASQVCAIPISLNSLIASDCQWFKAKAGLDTNQTLGFIFLAATQYCRMIFSKCSTC
jgi:hypothetical protein